VPHNAYAPTPQKPVSHCELNEHVPLFEPRATHAASALPARKSPHASAATALPHAIIPPAVAPVSAAPSASVHASVSRVRHTGTVPNCRCRSDGEHVISCVQRAVASARHALPTSAASIVLIIGPSPPVWIGPSPVGCVDGAGAAHATTTTMADASRMPLKSSHDGAT
jgi:hypothetical protein